jgi:cellulose biosynthesis protein BcsQ
MAKFIHADEAHTGAVDAVRDWLNQSVDVEALLVTDLFGKLRLVLFPSADATALEKTLSEACGQWWSGAVLDIAALDVATRQVFEDARATARSDEVQPRLKLVERHRSRTAWFSGPVDPPWKAPQDGAPIVVFYSFKGGLGRSTLLASFAIQRARAGQRVCVVDLDLDSPGIGRLLSADADGLTAQWGVVDFLLEHRMDDVRFDDYWHRCDRVSGDGEVRVMPAGRLDEAFPDKLGRVDLEEAPAARESGLWRLLERMRAELKPDWILLDARTGISEPAGQLLSGFAHLHVLLSSVQEQSWLGLDRVLDRLGKDRVLADKPQAEVLLVQAMVPAGEPGHAARESFAGRSEQTFEDRYYASDDEEADRFWTIADKQSQDAPHVAWPIDYDPRLATFRDIADVADALCSGAHAEIGGRIFNRFVREDVA